MTGVGVGALCNLTSKRQPLVGLCSWAVTLARCLPCLSSPGETRRLEGLEWRLPPPRRPPPKTGVAVTLASHGGFPGVSPRQPGPVTAAPGSRAGACPRSASAPRRPDPQESWPVCVSSHFCPGGGRLGQHCGGMSLQTSGRPLGPCFPDGPRLIGLQLLQRFTCEDRRVTCEPFTGQA